MIKKNIGILASMSWNSNNWASTASKEDIDNSNYDYVKEKGEMHEDLNFAHESLPTEDNGKFIAYTPMFNTYPSKEESKYVEIVFFRSLNHRTKQNCIMGFYALPDIAAHKRTKSKHKLYEAYDYGNVASLPENIVLFKNPILISNEIIAKENFVPKGKKLGQQGFNYLAYDNTLKILDKATELNPTDAKLKKIKFYFLSEKKYKNAI
ncbi:hypothetical protein [Flavobacterium sp. LB3R33]|jgi:5-methylcytosine-specific restriction protein A|uniref:hypothetical protein n=1 Tax=Flavobacterium sp. LB3R33 TaxID=3401721 RepID=UPI003AAAE842